MNWKRMALLVLTLSGFIGCAMPSSPASHRTEDPPPVKPSEQKSSRTNEPTGTITGVVRFLGPKPARKPLKAVAASPFCKECHPDKLPLSEQWVFGKNGNSDILQNVLVYVSNGVEGKTFEAPKDPVVLDQVGCVYTPHVVAVMTGQTLEVRNSDATLHNVMTMPPPKRNKEFNIGMSVKGGKVRKVFKSPEFNIRLMCMLHPWMKAYVHVLPHPFFAVTRADGTFTLKRLPPGEYEISVRHESSSFEAEPSIAKIKVEAGETRTADFTYRKKKQ